MPAPEFGMSKIKVSKDGYRGVTRDRMTNLGLFSLEKEKCKGESYRYIQLRVDSHEQDGDRVFVEMFSKEMGGSKNKQ